MHRLTLVAAHSSGGPDVIQSYVSSVRRPPDALKDQVGGAGLSGNRDLALQPPVALCLQPGPHWRAQVAASLRVETLSVNKG